nr:ral guanine nucleotide dissociation stimulator-like 2 isoform X2 [Pogona vitticeps]
MRLQELFLRLVPQECVGSLWSKQDRKCHERACPTVRATVAQFSLVAKAVVSSCLGDTGLRAAQRARLLEKWIRVAEECFCLQNFSSLYAIISALQSTPLHRLKRTWEKTSRDSLRCYEELSAVCSEEDNYSQSRRLLFQVTSLDKTPAVIAKVLKKHNQERSQAPQYKLVQLLSEGQELAFPPTTNVFYAMNSSCQDFMLRAKQGKPAPVAPPPPPRTPTPKGVEISATFPKIKATGRKIAKALF